MQRSSIWLRLTLLFTLASLGPLLLLGLGVSSLAGELSLRQVSEQQTRTVDGLALGIDTWLSRSFTLLELQASAFSLDDPSVRVAFLQLVYKQTPHAQIVALLDARGAPLAAPVYLSAPSDAFPQRTPATDVHVERFQEAIQALLPLSTRQLAVGQPYQPPGARVPVLPVVVPAGTGGAVVCVALALDELEAWLAEQGSPIQEVGLLDAEGDLILRSGQGLLVADRFRSVRRTPVSELLYDTGVGVSVIAAGTPIPRVDWAVVTASPMSMVTAAERGIRARAGYVAGWSAVLAVVLALLITRQLTRPIIALRDAALSVAEGELGRQVASTGREDELEALGQAFNLMSRSLQANAREIQQKNAEIEAFNRELQDRVEERTRQLREAQARLVDSARLAAVGELGAGLAHELNNPMAGILGLTQVLRARAPADPMLSAIEEQALRCRDILGALRQFTADGEDAPAAWGVVDLTEILRGVLTLVGAPLRQRGVEVDLPRSLPELPVRGDRAALGRALAALLTSLRALFPSSGGTLTITAAPEADAGGGFVGLLLTPSADAPLLWGGDDWRAAGMGLWSARQILDRHGGELREEPAGRWLLRLPRGGPRA